MTGLRYERILAGTALALILAVPTGAHATPQNETTSKVAAVPTAGAAGSPAASTPLPAPAAATAAIPDVLDVVVTPPPAAAMPAAVHPTAAPAAPGTTTPAAPGTATPPAEPVTAVEPPPDPLAALDPADRPVAEQIRDLLTVKADKMFASKRERAAVDAFYRSRNLAALWLDKGVENARARAVATRVKAADADGLQGSDYQLPSFAGLTTPEALAEAELKFTHTVLTFARHLQAGRFPYARISRNIELPQMPPDQAALLTKIAEATDAGMVLDELAPPHDGYKALKKALAETRGKTSGGREQIADGALLRFDPDMPMRDPRVPQLRRRLGVAGDPANLEYDVKLAAAVEKFQLSAGLPADGALGPRTIKTLNGPATPSQQVDLIIANMERWRWYPRDLGKAYSMANLPDFTLKVVKDGSMAWTTRIVIGKPSLASPLLSETMKSITVNPTWNIPPSIVYNEYLPALQQDPTVMARMGIRVTTNSNGSVHMYMPPGDQNALGRLRFNFPNRFLVYQHDTADKHMFGHEVRAYSHGCMRVQDPAKYAEILFGIARPHEGWNADRVKRMFGGAEQDFHLPTPIPVHLTYQTAFVDDAGKLQIRRDVYGLDSRTIAAIKSERGMIEPPPERSSQVASTTSSPTSSNGSGTPSRRRSVGQPQRELSFFEHLFGARPAAVRPPGRIAR